MFRVAHSISALRRFRRDLTPSVFALPSRRMHNIPDPMQIMTSPGGLMALMYGRTDKQGPEGSTSSSEGRRPRRRDRPVVGSRSRSDDGDGATGSEGEGGGGGQGPVKGFLSKMVRTEAFGLAVVIFVLSALWQFLQEQRSVIEEKVRSLFVTTLEVRSSQREYAMLMDWMARQPRGQRARNIALRPITVLDESLDDSRKQTALDSRASLVPGYGSHFFFFDRTPLWITRRADSSKEHGHHAHNMDRENDILTITLLSRSRSVVHEFLSSVSSSWRSHVKDIVQVFEYDYGWRLLSERSKRPMHSLYLPEDVKSVKDEIESFLQLRDTYIALGIPWRRGYLFDGPPGTGKSSYVLALASELHLPIHVLPIQSNLSDARLLKVFAELPPRCIVLLEDFENAIPTEALETPGGDRSTMLATSRDSGLTLGGLLNAIDGVASSEGRIVVMTTNDASKIPSPASLLRPGRIDRHVRFRKIEPAELATMQRAFEDVVSASPIPEVQSALRSGALGTTSRQSRNITPAEYQHELLNCIIHNHMREKQRPDESRLDKGGQ